MTVLHKKMGMAAAMLLLAMICGGRALAAEIRTVSLSNAPAEAVLTFTSPVPARVMKLDNHELLIALKGAELPQGLLNTIKAGELNITSGRQVPGVTTLLIHSRRPILTVDHAWRGSSLAITLTLKNQLRRIASNTVKQVAEVLPPSRVLGTPPEEEISAKGALVVRKGFTGTVDDLLLEVKSTLCSDVERVDRLMGLMNNGAWRRAETGLKEALDRPGLSRGCAEALETLLLLSLFREADLRQSHEELVELPGRFNDFISRFPDSVYLPHHLSMLGQIYDGLGDQGTAEGYYKLVLEDHAEFPGAAETLFKLGRLYRHRGRANEAVPILARVEKLGKRLSFAKEARKEYALALYDTGDFVLSQVLFETLIADGGESSWQDPDLLLYSGRSALRAGRRVVARKHFLSFINLFPDHDGAAMALESVGESWVDDGIPEKAIPFFRLVIERYPDTEGEVAASVRLAEQLQGREEKEALYQRVIDGFPEHPLARLSMLRLAALFDEAGEYEKSVTMVKQLLDAGAGGLRAEAYARMEMAVLGLFNEWVQAEDYVSLIAFHEKERRLLARLENPDIFLLSGKAFMEAHLYGSAAEELERAIVLSLKRVRWSGKDRLAGLYFKLGRALDEGGRKEEAKGILSRYLDQYENASGSGEASLRLGRLLFDEKETRKAEELFKQSLASGGGAMAHLWLSKCRQAVGDLASAATQLESAISLFEKEEPISQGPLFSALRRLGDVSVKLGRYTDAVMAYSRAENFAAEGSSLEELRFLQADALARGGEKRSALATYRKVAESEDEFWAGMATERLRAIELATRLDATP